MWLTKPISKYRLDQSLLNFIDNNTDYNEELKSSRITAPEFFYINTVLQVIREKKQKSRVCIKKRKEVTALKKGLPIVKKMKIKSNHTCAFPVRTMS